MTSPGSDQLAAQCAGSGTALVSAVADPQGVGPNPGPLVAAAIRRSRRTTGRRSAGRRSARRRSARRRRVLVIGNIGNGNVGDEAVFAGLRPYLGEAGDVVVLTRKPVEVRALHGVRSVDMVSRAAIGELLRADVIAVGGGGIFGLGMPPLVGLLPFVLCFARLVLGNRIVFQAIGAYPDTPQPTLGALQLAGRLADAVLVRDKSSFDVFSSGLARGATPILVGDPGVYLEPAPPELARQALAAGGVDVSRPPLVMSLKPTPDPELNARLVDTLAEVAQWWCDNRDADVVVLPMSDIGDYGLGPDWADGVLGERLAARIREAQRVKILPCDLPPTVAKAVIGQAGAVIAVRLHASIFGWSMGVPLLTLPFEAKTTTWLAQSGGDALPLAALASEAVIAWLEALPRGQGGPEAGTGLCSDIADATKRHDAPVKCHD